MHFMLLDFIIVIFAVVELFFIQLKILSSFCEIWVINCKYWMVLCRIQILASL